MMSKYLVIVGALLLPVSAFCQDAERKPRPRMFDFRLPPDVESRAEKDVVYGVYSGLALLMDVYRPEKPNGYGIVHVAGGGWATGLSMDAIPRRRYPHFLMEGLPLVKAGYTVFSVEHRAIPRFKYPDPVEDVQRAVRFIRHNASTYGIDPDRIGAMGGSSGGHLVAMLAVLGGEEVSAESPVEGESSRVQCVVARAAPSNFLKPDPRGSGLSAAFLGALVHPMLRPTDPEYRIAQEASPITHVSSDDPPILLLHGDADEVVPIELSREFLEALRSAGVISAG